MDKNSKAFARAVDKAADALIRDGLVYRVVVNGEERWALTPNGERAAKELEAELEKVVKK